MSDRPFVLSAKGIVKRFGPTSVLNAFDLSIAPGEVHAFLGGNGAGKSTFIKIISGQHERDAGELEFDGAPLSAANASHLDRGKIAVVNQELALLPHLSVAENIVMPRLRHAARMFSEKTARDAAVKALSLIDPGFAQQSVDRVVGDLTLHERQLVEIARALGSGAKLLLLDEPTANLTAAETGRLFAVIRRLIADTGLAVLFVSHRMREIRQIADVCTIIRDGRTAVNRVALNDITDREIVEYMGQLGAADTPVSPEPAHGERPRRGARSDSASDAITLEYGEVRLDIGAGDIIGLAGAPTGPSALIDALTGLAKHGKWTMTRTGKPLRYASPAAAARDGVGFISGDRGNKGVLDTLPIVDNLLAAERIVRGNRFTRSAEVRKGNDLLDALSIRASSLWDLPSTLSGGTQQKLLVARWLTLKPDLLVLEEPTRGVDIRTKREIYALVLRMAAEGTAVVWWSTEYIELVELCDTVLTFDLDGAPTGVLHYADINETELARATGMAA